MNWIDFVLAIILVLNIVNGFSTGLARSSIELLHLVVSIIVAAVSYPYAAVPLRMLGIPHGVSLFIGFGIMFVIVQVVLAITASPFMKKLKRKIKGSTFETLDKLLGPVPQIINFAITMSFFLALLISFPVANPVKEAILNSKYGQKLAQPAITVLAGQADKVKSELQSDTI